MTEELNEKNINEKKKKSELREIVEVVGIALVLAFLIKTFVVGNYWIPSESMLPTIEVNDKVVVTNFSYWLDGPERGDVVVFHYPLDPKKDYIKRCIGEPGEVIEFKDSKLYVNGALVEEPYLPVGLEFDDFGAGSLYGRILLGQQLQIAQPLGRKGNSGIHNVNHSLLE